MQQEIPSLTFARAFSAVLIALGVLAIAARPDAASAHPLGNFTINHLVKVDVRGRELHARYVLDMAEIPTFQVMRARDPRARMDAAQLQAWAAGEASEIERSLDVEADGHA